MSTEDPPGSGPGPGRATGFRRGLDRARRGLDDWVASWRGTIRDGAVRRRIRGWWPPSWRAVLIVGGVVFLWSWLWWLTCGYGGCPNVEVLASYQPGNAPVVLDRKGGVVTRLSPVSREMVTLADLPSHVADAFVAVEDRRFREHGGVDLRRVVGSALANVRAGGVAQGGSTITMQLARNVFPDRLPASQRTVGRKLLEVRVARQIEDRFTKDEILELYLNHIYFGGPVYGIETAARHYFGHGAADLDLAEAATLAAMPRAPNRYDPREHPERAGERRDLVLSLMADQGRITGDQEERARGRPVRTSWRGVSGDDGPPPAPWFVAAVRRTLEDRLGDALYAQPLRIRTTLAPAAQAAAEGALRRQLRSIERGTYGPFRGEARYGGADAVDSAGTRYLQGAVVVMDADSGDVLALVGGRDWEDSRFDRALRARRQAGSAFKPFVYAAALEQGYAPSQQLVDEPLSMELPGGEVWTPENFGGGYRGEVTLRQALVQSNNVATARLAMAVGLDRVARTAREAGIRSEIPILPSLSLGTAGLTLLELTGAYAPFATLGTAVRPRFILGVEDTTGATVWEVEAERERVLDPGVAYLLTDLLRDAVERGTGRAVRDAGFRGRAAGKTGTTDGGHDAWFIGYTPEVVGGVWIGLDRPAPIVNRASGGRLAAPVWGRMMREIHSGGGSATEWERPESVVERRVDPASGLVLAEGCRPERGEAVSELFLADHVPSEICPEGGDESPGFFTRVGRAVRSFFGDVGDFIAGLFEGDDEPEGDDARERERYLGRPRLPEARETPRVEQPDTTTPEPPSEPLGVPVESIPGWDQAPVEPADESDADTAAAPEVPIPEPTSEPVQEPVQEPVSQPPVDTGGGPLPTS